MKSIKEVTEEDEDLTKEELLANEDDILKGLLEASNVKNEISKTIEIARKGKVLLRFRIRPLSEEEYNKCKENATKYIRNRRYGGVKVPEDTDLVSYRSSLIYTATIEEDREKIWNNKAAWKALNVLCGKDLIEKVLVAGEKDAIIEKIDQISGYNSDTEEVIKN